MRLRRVEVQGFRNLGGPVSLEGLGDGLTVIAGDNEEGKSSLLAALKAAFFELHTMSGAAREAMNPWGREATPEVRVEFEVADQRWRLSKAFKRGGCSLEGPRTKLDGEGAERRLAELLRFERRAGRSPLKSEHMGLQALFWVDQGTTFDEAWQPTEASRTRLSAAIASEVDAVATGERGRRLSRAVADQCRRFWTPKWHQTGEQSKAHQRVEALGEERQQLLDRARLYESKVDKLAQLRGLWRHRAAGDALGQARSRLQEARAEILRIEALDRQLTLAIERAKAAQAEVSQLDAAARQRLDWQTELGARGQEMERAARRLEEARATLAQAAGSLGAAEAEQQAARSELEAAEAARERASLLVRARAATLRVAEFDRALAAVRTTAREVGEGRRRLAANLATPPRLRALNELAAARREALAALGAASTQVELHPTAGQSARLGGGHVASSDPLHLVERTELQLEGYGRIVVIPGGADIGERRARVAEAERALAGALREVGAESLAAAEELAGRRQMLEAELRAGEATEKAVLDSAGAASPEALGEMADSARGELDALKEQLGDGSAEGAEPGIEQATAAVAAASRRMVTAGEAVRAAEKRQTEWRSDILSLEDQIQGLVTQQQALAGRLAAERASRDDATLDSQLLAARQRLAAAATERDAAEQALRLANAEAVRDRLRLAERRVLAEEAQSQAEERRMRDLEVELRALGGDAAGERLAEVDTEIVAAEAAWRRVRIEARAWRMLDDEVRAAEAEARAMLIEPVRERLAPYLARLFPTAEALLDPELMTLTHLRRDGVDEPFASLSVGTREQIAVLVRLAFARLLLEREGEASCLVLDDALVYADEGRFETMKTILERAARDLQIIVLTCRPRDYLGLDARQIRLEDCRP